MLKALNMKPLKHSARLSLPPPPSFSPGWVAMNLQLAHESWQPCPATIQGGTIYCRWEHAQARAHVCHGSAAETHQLLTGCAASPSSSVTYRPGLCLLLDKLNPKVSKQYSIDAGFCQDHLVRVKPYIFRHFVSSHH